MIIWRSQWKIWRQGNIGIKYDNVELMIQVLDGIEQQLPTRCYGYVPFYLDYVFRKSVGTGEMKSRANNAMEFVQEQFLLSCAVAMFVDRLNLSSLRLNFWTLNWFSS